MPKDSGAYLRYLVAKRGWQAQEFIRRMQGTGEIASGTLEESVVRRWYIDGPPQSGNRHRAMISALQIVPDTADWHYLVGKKAWRPRVSDLLGWLHDVSSSGPTLKLEPAIGRGVQPLPGTENDLVELVEGTTAHLVLRIDQPSFVMAINHSYADGVLGVLFPSKREPDALVMPVNCIAVLPSVAGAGYPVGGPPGENDLYAVLSSEPVAGDISWLTRISGRALLHTEAEQIGQALAAGEKSIDAVHRFPYRVI